MIATQEAINPIEWAVLFAALVLSWRLYSLIRASTGVASTHRAVLERLAKSELSALERRVRGLGYHNPYGDLAHDLIQAAQLRIQGAGDREGSVDRAYLLATHRARRRTQQGHITDAVALIVGSTVVLYSRGILPEGPLFWSCAGAMLAALVATFAARGLLLSNLLTSAAALKSSLLARSQPPSGAGLPDLSSDACPCPWCGASTQHMQLSIKTADLAQQVEAVVCTSCGKLVATLDLEPEIPNK